MKVLICDVDKTVTPKWQKVSPDEAKQNGLYGVRGWLVVFAIGLLLGSLRSFVGLSDAALTAGMSIGELFAIDQPMVTVIKIVLAIDISSIAIIYWLLLSKHPNFRPIATWILLANWPIAVVVGLANPFPGIANGLALGFFPWMVSCAVWVTYLQRSRRVRVTFEHSIRSKENGSSQMPPERHPFPERTKEDQHVAPTNKDFEGTSSSEHFYEVVADELETGNTKKGLWTKAFVEANGDDKQTKLGYIKMRMEQLEAEEKDHVQQQLEGEQEKERQRQQKETFARMFCERLGIHLDYGLYEAVSAIDLSTAHESLDDLRKLADSGYARAQWLLGIKYLKGEGVDPDFTKGHEYIATAAAQGHTQAQKILKVLNLIRM